MSETVQIPKGWEIKKLGELLENKIIESKKGKKPSNVFSEKTTDSLPYVDIKAFEKNIITNYGRKDDGVVCKKDDVLLVWDGSRSGLTGIGIDGLVGSTIVSLKCSELLLPMFLFYFIKSKYKLINSNHKGGSIPHVKPELFWNLSIPLLPISTQKKIVQKLDDILQQLEEKQILILTNYERQLNRNKKQKQIFYQSILNSATFGKFTNNWRKKYPNAKVSNDILKLHNPSLLDSTLLSEIPKNWAILTLQSISDIRGGTSIGRKLSGELISMPYLRVANVQDGFLDLQKIKETQIKTEEREKWLLQKHDILLTEGGDWDKLGRGTIWNDEISNCIHQNHIFRVRMNFSEINAYFISYVIASTYGKKYFQKSAKRTTNLATINSTQLKALPIFCPPIDEQKEIVKITNEKMKYLDIIESHTKHYSQLTENSQKYIKHLSSSILDAAFSGKLVK